MALIKLESKAGFLLSRGVLAVIAFAKILLVIRVLPLEEYAKLGIIESVRVVVIALIGMGISEAMAREGGGEADYESRGRILFAGLFAAAFLAAVGLLVMVTLAGFVAIFLPASGMAGLLLIAAAIVPAERLYGALLGSLQATHDFAFYIRASLAYGIVIAAVTVPMTALWGVSGYFAAQAIVTVITVGFMAHRIAGQVRLPEFAGMQVAVTDGLRRLWSVGWFAFASKTSMIAWRRLPLLAVASVLPPKTLGLVAATMDISSKMHLAYEALLPMVLPKLSRAFRQDRSSFLKHAKKELRSGAWLSAGIVVIAVSGWLLLGNLFVGRERFIGMRELMLAAIAMESILLATNLLVMCVLLPSGRVTGLSIRTLAARALAVPFVFAFIASGFPARYSLFAAMAVAGSIVLALYVRETSRALVELATPGAA